MTVTTILLTIAILFNCYNIFLSNKTSNLKKATIEEIINLSNYNYPKPSDEDTITIAILNTNDIHGAAFKQDSQIGDEPYSRAGMETLAPYVMALRKEFKDQFLWLDSGDQFSGTLESKLTDGKIMTDLFNVMGLNAATLGNHEFDWGQDVMESFIKSAKFPYIVDNIQLKEQGQSILDDLVQSKLFDIKGIKIGVTGISTIYTPVTTGGDTSEFLFLKYIPLVEKKASELRKQGANLVILLAHAGIECKSKTKEDYLKNRLTTEEDDISKCEDSEIYNLAKQLKPGTFDAIYAGHIHKEAHTFVKGIPIMQNNFHALSIHVGYFTFNKKTKEYLKNETVIEGPVPICSKIFDKSRDCRFFGKNVDTKEVNQKFGKLRKFSFHGSVISPVKQITDTLNRYKSLVNDAKSKVVLTTNIMMKRDRDNESPLANYVCDLLRNISHANVCIINQGMFRGTWYPGPVSYYQFYEMFSLNTDIVTAKITGKQLKRIMEILNNGLKAFYATSGITSYVKTSPKRLSKVTLSDGSPIEDSKEYILVSNEYFLNGGDDFSKVLKEFPVKIDRELGEFKDLALKYIKQFPLITKEMAIHPDRPSLVFVKEN